MHHFASKHLPVLLHLCICTSADFTLDRPVVLASPPPQHTTSTYDLVAIFPFNPNCTYVCTTVYYYLTLAVGKEIRKSSYGYYNEAQKCYDRGHAMNNDEVSLTREPLHTHPKALSAQHPTRQPFRPPHQTSQVHGWMDGLYGTQRFAPALRANA